MARAARLLLDANARVEPAAADRDRLDLCSFVPAGHRQVQFGEGGNRTARQHIACSLLGPGKSPKCWQPQWRPAHRNNPHPMHTTPMAYTNILNLDILLASAVPVLEPASKDAATISHLFLIVFLICLAILLVVAGLICVSLMRFRADGSRLPQQNFGSHRSEVVWGMTPVAIGIALSVLSARVIVSDESGAAGDAEVVVVGHQWWWEVRYPGRGGGAVTANEIHIPVGRRVRVRVESADVIHSLWVPQLGPKKDMIRGHPNFVWLEADRAGTYEGACSEFCGDQHAWMRFIVVAEPEPRFRKWLEHQASVAANPVNESA